MLRSIEVTAVLTLGDAPLPNLHWTGAVELSLDCFICRRTGRTTDLTHGAEHASCSGDARTPRHPTAARIVTFDQDQTTVRVVVDYWWAPFRDAKYESPGPGAFSIQANLVRPHNHTCEHCSASVAQSLEGPRIRLLT